VRTRLSGAAFVVSSIALFVALSGGAIAAGIVPLAKHAVTADTASNAKKLGGMTPAHIRAAMRGAQGPAGPAGATGPAGPAGPAGATGAAGAQGPQGSQGPQGPQGDQGPVGAGLKIVGTVATVGALPTTGTTGDAYLIGGVLYVWTGSAWTNAGPVQGPKGDTGTTGATGPQGPQGPSGTAAVTVHTEAFTLAVNGASGDTQDVVVSCGSGQKAVGGGYSSTGNVFNLDTRPTASDDGWAITVVNDDNTASSGTAYATCLG
jgi:Collagen triple helix repeat (20 copies)